MGKREKRIREGKELERERNLLMEKSATIVCFLPILCALV
jgi:hypothetical protein